MPTLETDRLVLRDFGAGDFEAFFATTQDPEYRRFYAERETTREFWRGLFGRFLADARQSERTRYQLAVCLKSGEVIGTCGVRIESTTDQQASFGSAIARQHWGHGYAGEAAQRLAGWAFAELPVHRLYVETVAENRRARALAERLGMRLEGELRHHRFFRGRWWNTAMYATLRDEWEGVNRCNPWRAFESST